MSKEKGKTRNNETTVDCLWNYSISAIWWWWDIPSSWMKFWEKSSYLQKLGMWFHNYAMD